MKIVFDTTRLSYLGYRAAHPAISQNGNFIASTYQDRFIIGWFSLSPITIASDTLIVIRWQGTPGPPVRLWFDTTRGMCELVNFYGVRFNTQFIDGLTAPSIRTVPILVSPPDTSGYSSSDVLFVYEESPCRTGPTVIQVSRDSSFASDPSVSLFLSSSTFYKWFSIPFCGGPLIGGLYPDNGPCWHASSGDSIVFWRVGAVYDSDTLWSFSRRISLSMTAGLQGDLTMNKSLVFPNPVRKYFCLQVPDSVVLRWETACFYKSDGTHVSQYFFNEGINYPSTINARIKFCYIAEKANSGAYYLTIKDQTGAVYLFSFIKI
jgi:hypothetical protein